MPTFHPASIILKKNILLSYGPEICCDLVVTYDSVKIDRVLNFLLVLVIALKLERVAVENAYM